MPTCDIGLRRYSLHLFTCQNGHNILDSRPPSEAVSDAEILVTRILYEDFGQSLSWTPELPRVHKCFREFDFSDFMSMAALCGWIVREADKRRRISLKFMTCELADGFKIFRDWPDSFRKVVAERIAASPADFSMVSNWV
ncbi:hypothetical protein ACFPL7_23245 [Dongia soli]|uniref:Uncharacterized protein n=1 Tax=Dongia soli TaxID=600628 RepID=A0ABU5ELJ0_9PROT|nr:hypothetical protein [Dongia soli]MDY0885888.1 hypothetical protein [Dongia soli]